MAQNQPTAFLYLVQDTGRKNDDGTDKSAWTKIGAIFKNAKGSGVVWDFMPIPTNGRHVILPNTEDDK